MSDIILRFPTSVTIQGGEQIQVDWTQANTEALDYIKNKPAIPAPQIQSDYTQSDSNAVDYIKNKPANIVQDANYVHTANDFSDIYKGYVDKNVPLTNQTLNTEINLSTHFEVYYNEKAINTAFTPTISANPLIGAAARVVLNAGSSASLVATNLGTKLPESSDFTASKLNELIVYSLPEGIAYTIAILN